MKIRFKEVPPNPVACPLWIRKDFTRVKEVPATKESAKEYTVLYVDLIKALGKVSPPTAEALKTWKGNQSGRTVVFSDEFCEEVPTPAGQTRSGFGTQGGGGRSG